MILLASEINTELLNILAVDFYVQIACPRLSIDWAYGTPKPLLTPYELYVLMDKINIKEHYSMDFYSMNGGPWSNFYGRVAPKPVKKALKTKPKVQLKM
jgi:2-(3-amino-3-carboxypropyl)histidine synthase